MSNWRDREQTETATEWLRRVGPQIKAANERQRAEDVRDLRYRLRTAALAADAIYDQLRVIIADITVDGHDSAAEGANVALLRLKQAEMELERARDRVAVPSPPLEAV